MFEIILFGIFCFAFFILGVLVASNNKAKTDELINELKEKIEKLKEKE